MNELEKASAILITTGKVTARIPAQSISASVAAGLIALGIVTYGVVAFTKVVSAQ